MPRVKLDLDAEVYERLLDQAEAERRPILWQAEVTLRRALGLPFPTTPAIRGGEDDPPQNAA